MKKCPECGNTYDDNYAVCPRDETRLVDADPSKTDPLIGNILAGRYQVVAKIGQGGMGAVYKVIQTKMDRVCAVKMLTALSSNEAAVARFNREARNSSRIDNPHAVTIYDYGETEGGALYLAMEFIDGRTLSDVLDEAGSLQIGRVVEITDQIAEALEAAHALGIIHRDLKPDNIMITSKSGQSDYVKVLDFGIAKTVTDDEAENVTKTGFVLGTPVYMSPEQLSGEKLDPRSDVYSLAIIVYEMLTGDLPFEGDNPQAITIKRLMSDPIPLRVYLPNISQAVERVVMAALARDREDRTPTVKAFASALDAAARVSTQSFPGRATTKLSEDPSQQTVEWTGPLSGMLSNPEAEGAPTTNPSLGAMQPSQNLADTRVSEPPLGNTPGQSKTMGYTSAPRPGAMSDAPTVLNKAVAPSSVASIPEQRKPLGLWVGGGLAAVAVIAIALFLLVGRGPSGFTLVVQGAPPGSEVTINGVRHGVTSPDGKLTVSGLGDGEQAILITHEGFVDFSTTVSGRSGVERPVDAKLLPFSVNHNGQMVLIPAGEFIMGDDSHESDEKPAQTVTLPAFYIDKYEVTNAEYKKFCDTTGRQYPPNPPWDPNYISSSPDAPVLSVSWDDAAAYANWAGKRLPSEEEWEKAASWDPAAQKKRQWPWGNDRDPSRANIGSTKTNPVDSLLTDRSAYGVFGLAGNASEWVDAFYQPYKGNQMKDPSFGQTYRVMRGGNYKSSIDEARAPRRDYLQTAIDPQKSGLTGPIGFRCAISADDTRLQASLLQQ